MLFDARSPLDPRDRAPEQFLSRVVALGVSEEAGRRLMSRVVGRGVFSSVELNRSHQIPRKLCNAMGELPRLRLVDSIVSPVDGFRKLAFATTDDLVIETVLIPLKKPGAVSVCLSSQVGCPMGCTYCATARMRDRRNLATWEIVDQLIQARTQAEAEGRRVTGAVFMGMGEPFLNYDRVLAAAEILSAPFGAAISGPAITISTVGLVPEIDRFTRERRRFRLSISLGAAMDQKRRVVMPLAAQAPVAEVMAAARRHIQSRGTGRVMLSYVCISGFNVSEQDARELAELIGDTPVRLDLIEVTDPTGRFQRPTPEEWEQFRDALTRHVGQPVVRRYSGGADIAAACGTLAGTV
ncbi:MAG: radical SAM protein [Planctomycetes bacterium]|nr:radical SAM protein [Planctomycetota bacterium]